MTLLAMVTACCLNIVKSGYSARWVQQTPSADCGLAHVYSWTQRILDIAFEFLSQDQSVIAWLNCSAIIMFATT
ncbi:hypothetical protein K470DRAFT_254757 [Piedraia hortae CBS 480.64]|uniref:Uncharacterized protein n=1 Tax=Piedraia hortae CBS 480.64 TaxID=1314780 RepID=A0A6A7C8Z4_9PEZI|nr:hypothetical protein K470DRAFT_254757 [Piedraia hortae CBS 480.64]